MSRRLATPSARAGVAVAALTLVALVLRAPQMTQSLFADELWAYDAIAGRSLSGVIANVGTGPELNPPLWFVLAWASAQLGDPTVWMRLPSLVFGVALVPATYALGTLTVGRLAGLAGATVIALAPFTIEYSIEARPYAMLAFLVVASTACLLRALESDRAAWWVGYALASAAAVYTHYTAVFALAAQAAWAAWAWRGRLLKLAGANAAALGLFVPWLPQVLTGPKPQVLELAYGRFDPSPRAVARTVAHMLPGSPFVALARIPGVAAAGAFTAGAALALAGTLVSARGRLSASRREPIVLVALLFPVGLAGLLAVSGLLGNNLFGPRTAISVFPYLALTLGWLLVRSPAVVGALAALLIGGSLVAGALLTAGDAGQRPRYREAARYIEATLRPGDVVLERELFPIHAPLRRHLSLYLPSRVPHLREGRDDARAWEAARRGGRVLFVQVIAPAPRGRLPATLGPDRLVPVERRLLAGMLPVSVATYRRAASPAP
jgi:4-amino-4-deoxy-L-arabinose transferase-like glycosyltransferase